MFEQLCYFCLDRLMDVDGIAIGSCSDSIKIKSVSGEITEFETFEDVETYLIKKIIEKDLCKEFMEMLLGDN